MRSYSFEAEQRVREQFLAERSRERIGRIYMLKGASLGREGEAEDKKQDRG